MFLNKEDGHSPIVNTPFTTTTDGFRYLCVRITPKLSEIIPANYDPLVDGVTEALKRWSNLPISMVGQMNIIKMTILPKFLYYFQTLPLPRPNMFYDKLFGQFIWNDRKARLHLKLLYLPYERGGFNFPILVLYGCPTDLRIILFLYNSAPSLGKHRAKVHSRSTIKYVSILFGY